MIDVSAGELHFIDHVAPIWKALPQKIRGTFYVPTRRMEQHAREAGIQAEIGSVPRASTLALVASWGDLRRLGPDTKAIYMEHGAGISYGDGSPSYAGGKGRENVVLFLCPNENVERVNQAAWPGVPTAVVGCPKLDDMKVRGVEGRTVAISFHWPCVLIPETSWAFPFYRNYLRRLAERAECQLIGHGHPRAWRELEVIYRRLGIETTWSFEEVMDRSDLYIVDNSSTLFEASALGRPTVVLNSPRYRRDLNLGLRFWDGIPGPQVNHGETLASTVKAMLDGDWQDWEFERMKAVRLAYGIEGNDGKATKRAVEAIKKYCR